MVLGIDPGMIVIDTKDISKVSTTFLVFFLVYYGGQCYQRYFAMYNACMQMAGDVPVSYTHLTLPTICSV